MCGVLFTWWVGRKNNGPIRQSDVRGSAVNTRVVKLAPVKVKETENSKQAPDGEETMTPNLLSIYSDVRNIDIMQGQLNDVDFRNTKPCPKIRCAEFHNTSLPKHARPSSLIRCWTQWLPLLLSLGLLDHFNLLWFFSWLNHVFDFLRLFIGLRHNDFLLDLAISSKNALNFGDFLGKVLLLVGSTWG